MNLIQLMLAEQIAALRASAGVFGQQRADALASAESLAVQAAGSIARADELQAELDAYSATLQPAVEPAPDLPA